MRKIVCTCLLLMIFIFVRSQNPIIVKYDSISNFSGDLPVGVFQQPKGIVLLKIKSNDSTILYKRYFQSTLIETYQCNLSGYLNGYYYSWDSITHNISRGLNSKGRMVYSYTTTPNLDTVEYTKKINDTLYEWMQIRNGDKTIWQLNADMINNGYYKTFDLETNKIIMEGHYKAIKESEIVDKKKYRTLLKKYNRDDSFRNEPSETEIPVGTWYYYDKNGKLIKTIKYNWEGVFR